MGGVRAANPLDADQAERGLGDHPHPYAEGEVFKVGPNGKRWPVHPDWVPRHDRHRWVPGWYETPDGVVVVRECRNLGPPFARPGLR